MKALLAKTIIVAAIISTTLSINNGYSQSTRIEIQGLDSPCYGTLLSKSPASGSYSVSKKPAIYAPQEVIDAFAGHSDADNYFYLNFFQDVSEGLLYWPHYPPEKFKVLLYFPETDTFMTSEAMERYALHSTYSLTVQGDGITLEKDYDYKEFFLSMLIRIVVGAAAAIIATLLYSKTGKPERRYIIISCIVLHGLLNVLVSIYSFRNGFSMVEYLLFMVVPYTIFTLIQGYIYSKKIRHMEYPYLGGFAGNFAAYAVGMLMADCIPRLFTVV